MTPRRVRLSPGWTLLVCAVALMVSAWLPWLTTAAGGGGRASAIGGTVGSIVAPHRFGAGQLITLLSSVLMVLAAMVARAISPRLAAAAATVISVLVAVLTWWYHRANVVPPVDAGYGWYVGSVCAFVAVLSSVWALASSVLSS